MSSIATASEYDGIHTSLPYVVTNRSDAAISYYHAHCHKKMRVYTGGAQVIIIVKLSGKTIAQDFVSAEPLLPSTPEPVPAPCLLPSFYSYLFFTSTSISQVIQQRQGAKELSFMPYARRKGFAGRNAYHTAFPVSLTCILVKTQERGKWGGGG